MTFKPLLVLTALACVCGAGAQLSTAEKKGLEDVLFVGNLTSADLVYARVAKTSPWAMPWLGEALGNPLKAADTLMSAHASVGDGELSKVLEFARTKIFGDGNEARPLTVSPGASQKLELPPALRAPIERLAINLAQANAEVKGALFALSPEEQRTLIEQLPHWAVGDKSVPFEFSPRPHPETARLLELVGRVRLDLIRRAAGVLARSAEHEGKNLRAAMRTTGPVLGEWKFTLFSMKVVVSGSQSDDHADRDAMLTIDLGGNDRYTGRHGAGVGYASVLLDLTGDDVYDVPDLSIGAGLLGIGLAYDLGGHDVFRGRSLCFGTGLAGVGGLYKEGGDDVYVSTSLAQGFGLFGVGVLQDTRGRDRYELGAYGQGAARTGGVGWLVDRAGDDLYKAGGLVVEAPLLTDVYRSCAQGASLGYPGTGGGAGLLTDTAGHDTYLGETWCQGAGGWGGVGSLQDGAGNDRYQAVHLAQASGGHAGAGLLADLAGDDVYVLRLGAGHAFAESNSVALLLDRAGDDTFLARDARPGTGSAGGTGLFIDAEGDDFYASDPGLALGGVGTASVGAFVDLGGADRYGLAFGDAMATGQGRGGVAWDADPLPPIDTGRGVRSHPVAGSEPVGSPAVLAALYARLSLGAERATEAIDRFVAMGVPACKWLLDTHLVDADPSERVAMAEVISAVGDEARTLLTPFAAAPDPAVCRAALALGAATRSTALAPQVMAALQRPGVLVEAIRAAGALGVRAALPELMGLAASDDPEVASAVLLAMRDLRDPSVFGTAQFLLGSSSLPVRRAAMDLALAFPPEALALAKLLVAEPDEKRARSGLELCAGLGTPEALQIAGGALNDGRPGVRIQALLALSGRCPEAYKATVAAMRNDPFPMVRAVAKSIPIDR